MTTLDEIRAQLELAAQFEEHLDSCVVCQAVVHVFAEEGRTDENAKLLCPFSQDLHEKSKKLDEGVPL